MGGACTVHRVRTWTTVVGGVVAIANRYDVASGNWRQRKMEEEH